MSTRPGSSKDDAIIIIGAGVFGLSLAYELAGTRGYTNVTVVDRFLAPVPDGSSVDISRVVRTEYADPVYTRMAVEAVAGWRTQYSSHFSECGFVMLADGNHHPYIAKAIEYGKDSDSKAQGYTAADTPLKIKTLYPSVQAKLEGKASVHNPEGGWADAEASISTLARRASQAGVNFISGKKGTVTGFVFDETRTKAVGIQLLSGIEVAASRIVVAAGAWTNSLIPDVNHALSASGQPVAFIQLTPEETAAMSHHPVLIDFNTGVFCFPPTPNGILKLARHGYGYATSVPAVYGTVKRTVSSPNRDKDNSASNFLPPDADKALREGLARFFPNLADRPWLRTRLCWYTDTPQGDFVIDDHPRFKEIFMATGGAGQYVYAFQLITTQIIRGQVLTNVVCLVLSNSYQFSANTLPTASRGSLFKN